VNHFLFDLGNVVVQLDYERVITNLCSDGSLSRDGMIALLEQPGGYRDLERGAVSFADLHRVLRERAGYRGDLVRFREVWSDFFEGPVDGIERVLRRVRKEYRVAFLSNSNEVHAEVIRARFAELFRPEDIFIFSHEHGAAKPDRRIFVRALEILHTQPSRCIYVDDLVDNVAAAGAVGMTAFLFSGSELLLERLEEEGLLSPEPSS
jgi:putative hydrolase of the HAD superfamily